MIDQSQLQSLIQVYGLWLLAPLAVLEGPIVTMLAGYLVKLGLLSAPATFVVCVLGDLIGDVAIYSMGRFGPKTLPARWQLKLGLRKSRRVGLREHFDTMGGRTLLLGKLTHSAGAAVLFAAGTGKMPIAPFLLYNLIGTLPKTALFLTLGYFLGYAADQLSDYVLYVSLVITAVAAMALYFFHCKRRTPTE